MEKTFQKMKTGRSDRFRNTLRQDGEMNSVENDRGKCLAFEVNDPSILKTVAGEEKCAYLSADNVYYEMKSFSLCGQPVLLFACKRSVRKLPTPIK